jgi:hypothetical protein
MKKVNLFFLGIFFALTLIILPFSAIAAERADDKSLEKITRKAIVKKCKGNIDENEFAKFINYIKGGESETFCYDCKQGIVLGGRRGKCHVRVSKQGPNSYIIR